MRKSITNQDLITVIVPVYNVADYLPRFLKSLKEQTYKNFQVVLVDDGSKDNSLAVCQKFSKDDKRFVVIHENNKGTGAARNLGLSYAKGKYIYFCDPDDYLEKNLLKDNYKVITNNNADVVIFGYYEEEYGTKHKKQILPNTQNEKSFVKLFPSLYNQNLISSLWNKLYLKDAIKNQIFSHARTGQDNRFNLKFFEEPRKVVFNDKAYYHYIAARPSSAQTKKQIDKAKLKIEEVQLLEKLAKKWKESKNQQFIDLINKVYISVLWSAIEATRSMTSVTERRKILQVFFKLVDVQKIINGGKRDSLKERYKLFIIKNVNSTASLTIDKIIGKTYRKFKKV